MTNHHGAQDHGPNRVNLTPGFVKSAEPPTKGDRIIYWDEGLPGFGLMVTKAGAKSFVAQYRAKGIGVSRRKSWKAGKGGLSLDKGRQEARIVLADALKGKDTVADERRSVEKTADAKDNTLKAVIEQYTARSGKKLRSGDQRRAAFERLLYPTKLANQPIHEIRRSDIVRLLDTIEDERGIVMADRLLAYLRKAFNWYSARDDEFTPPIVRGMARTKPKERQRKRVLDDREIRAIWQAVEESPSAFGRFVQFTLLTGARRNEAARARHTELSSGDWTIPPERYKTKLSLVIPLSAMAVDVLGKTPRIGDKGYVFTTDGRKAIAGFSKFKRQLDRASGVTDWTIHDLRRSSRTLLSRAGISVNIAERCIGHLPPGIEANYDVHEYYDEKKHAFESLASLIGRILDPQPNVVGMKRQST